MAQIWKATTRRVVPETWQPLAHAVVTSQLVSLGLLIIRFIAADSFRYTFMVWNLFLGWVPLVFIWLLRRNLEQGRPWTDWRSIVYGLAWLTFLPNSFYILSDFIHLRSTYEVSVLYDVVLFGSFTWNGFLLGFVTLFMFHELLLKKLSPAVSHGIIGMVLLLCSFAIYLGRYLRWNTWDLIFQPAGILFDVSDRIINPGSYPRTFMTTFIFLALLCSIYYVVWQLVAFIRDTGLRSAERTALPARPAARVVAPMRRQKRPTRRR